jgi:hypothetical protein
MQVVKQLLLLLLLPVAIARHQCCLAAPSVVDVSRRHLLLVLPSSTEDTIVQQNDVGADFRQLEGRSLQLARQAACSSVQLGTCSSF